MRFLIRSEFSDLRHETSSAPYSHFADDVSLCRNCRCQDGRVPDVRDRANAIPRRYAARRDGSPPPEARWSTILLLRLQQRRKDIPSRRDGGFPSQYCTFWNEIARRIRSRLRMDASSHFWSRQTQPSQGSAFRHWRRHVRDNAPYRKNGRTSSTTQIPRGKSDCLAPWGSKTFMIMRYSPAKVKRGNAKNVILWESLDGAKASRRGAVTRDA